MARRPGLDFPTRRGQRRRPSFSRLAAPAITLALLLLPFALFWRETWGQAVFYYYDLFAYFYPYHKLVVDVTRAGHLPLWNPFAFSGIPLLGDGQTAIFYPPNWTFWLLPTPHALTVSILLHFSLAGVGMFLYMRSLRFHHVAALLAALAFMFNGFLVSHALHLSILAGGALIPLVLWRVEVLLQRPGRTAFVLAAAVVALQATTGHPQAPIYTAATAGLYVLVIGLQHAYRGQRRAPFVSLAYLAGVYLVGYALAAVQLVPWVEFAQFSPRAASASYELVMNSSLGGRDWLLFLFPYAYAGLQTSWLQADPTQVTSYLWERLPYVGGLTLALAAIGLSELPRLRRLARESEGDEAAAARLHGERLWALLALLVVALLYAAGDNTPFGRLSYALPVLGKLRIPARGVSIACFALPALAAYGVMRLSRPLSQTRPRLDPVPLLAGVGLVTLCAGAILATSLGLWDRLPPGPLELADQTLNRTLRLDQPNAYVPLALAGLGALGLAWASLRPSRLNRLALLGLVAFDLLGVAITFNPTGDLAIFERVPPTVEFLKRDPSLYRVAVFMGDTDRPMTALQDTLAISWAMPYHIEDINGFNSLQPLRYTEFLFGEGVEDVSYGWLEDESLLQAQAQRLSLLDVKYALVQPQATVTPDPAWAQVYANENVTIYRNPQPHRRAYYVDQVIVEPDPAAILAALRQPGFEPTRQAFVEAALPPAEAPRAAPDGPAAAEVERPTPNDLVIRVQTPRERFLVLSEMWFPGWRAELEEANGTRRPLPIYRVNYLFRGLLVPAGEYTVHMAYRPLSVSLGAAVTLLTLLGCVVAVASPIWRRGFRPD